MRKILVLLLIIFCQKTFSQDSKVSIEKFLRQSNLEFGIAWNSLSTMDSLPRFTMDVRIDDSIKSKFNAMTKKELKHLINNEETQWNTNLLLYELYKKNAMIFFVVKDIKKWESTYKQSDLEYWNAILVEKF